MRVTLITAVGELFDELEQARLLAYRCAWRLDQSGHHGAWRDVSLIIESHELDISSSRSW